MTSVSHYTQTCTVTHKPSFPPQVLLAVDSISSIPILLTPPPPPHPHPPYPSHHSSLPILIFLIHSSLTSLPLLRTSHPSPPVYLTSLTSSSPLPPPPHPSFLPLLLTPHPSPLPLPLLLLPPLLFPTHPSHSSSPLIPPSYSSSPLSSPPPPYLTSCSPHIPLLLPPPFLLLPPPSSSPLSSIPLSLLFSTHPSHSSLPLIPTHTSTHRTQISVVTWRSTQVPWTPTMSSCSCSNC